MKRRTVILLVFGIAAAASASLLALLGDHTNSLFWISLVFWELSLAVAAAAALLGTEDTRFSFPVGISILAFACLYIVLVALVDFLLGWLWPAEPAVFLSIHLAALGLFAIIGILLFLAKRSIARQNESAYAASYEQQILLGEVDRLKFLAQKLPDAVQQDAARQLAQLQEAIRYSDLIPHNAVSDIDNRIRAKVFSMACELDNLIDIESEDISAIHAAVADICRQIAARNHQLKNAKSGI